MTIGDRQVAIADAEIAVASGQPEAEEESAPPVETQPDYQSPEPDFPPVEPTEEEPRPGIERPESLETPQAVAEREQSEYAYTDLAPEQTEELLRESFAPQLKQLDADPSRALADVTIESAVSPTEAIVETEGEKALLESTVPIRVPAEDGKLAKVDLGLEQTEDGGFAPKNSLVDVSLPADSSGAIEVGDIALTLAASAAVDVVRGEASTARAFGEEDLILPEVAEDTSLFLSPVTGGVELSALVASRRSPEQLSFAVTMPAGAQLRPATDGGVEVVGADDRGELIARIGVPFAVDAQGTNVPVALLVKEDTITLDFPHRSMDIAYPLFIDPEIEENWWEFADTSKLNYWQWQWSGVGSEDYIGQRWCIVTCWGNGLYVRARSNFGYPGGSYGRWWFTPQGSTTYMRRVIFGPMHLDPHINPSNPQNCWNGEPHGYVGVWNNGGFWSVHAPARPTGVSDWVDTGSQDLGSGARTAFVGMHADSGANLKCGRDYAMNGAVLYLNDPENPSVNANGYPSGWLKDNSPFTLNVPVHDPGLGVKSATVAPYDSPPLPTKELGCTGHYNSQCPANHTFQWAVSADSYDQGEKEVRVSAKDAMGKTSNTFSFMMKVDRTPPDVALSGQLATATQEAEGESKDPTAFDPLGLPVYNLTIKAEDGVENGTAAQRRSGVKSIEVFLDKKAVPEKTWTQSPCNNSCGMTQTYTLKLNELTALTHHTLRVVIKDHAGNTPREREIEFEYVPATGMKEEYVLHHFPLPSGQGDENSEENPIRPELAVNVMNGNLVYRQLDAEVPGPVADLEVERFYNSLLPDSQDTEWGEGWTLAQTPTLEAEEAEAPGPPAEATLVEESGAVESQVDLPVEVGEEQFDEQLQAVIARGPSGYEITDESGEGQGTLVFNEAGRSTELETGEYAGVEYRYEGGLLDEIAVEDIASAKVDPAEVEEPEHSGPAILHSADIGEAGSGGAQFQAPADVITDPAGNLWVADKENNRVQKLSPDGQLLLQFGTYGSEDGQFKGPSALAFDQAGNLWVVDQANGRLQKFSPGGQFLAKFGSPGLGNGKLTGPNGVVVDDSGVLWISDSVKVQRFTASGEFIERVGTSGSAPGQISSPKGLDLGPEGNVFVAEAANNRISVFNGEGDYVRLFGAAGAGPGQLSWPLELDVDQRGYVWVADSQDRVQLFSSAGDYIAGFGEPGGGEGQLDLSGPVGVATDGVGRIWIADSGNDRVGEWIGGIPNPPLEDLPVEGDDPAADVAVSEGLVEVVAGEEVGEISYEHTNGLLTAVEGPEGETSYEYDDNDRMTKVTLANGTYAEIAYEETYGRVESVTVALEGANPKTTYFTYEDEPRKTTVTAPGVPVTTYEFAADGSMLKWWNTKKPPTIDDIGGTLYDLEARETAGPIAPGLYNLEVQAFDPEGIASIQIITNNNVVVSEKTCSQIPGPPVECETEEDQWVLETGSFSPGILYLEIVATDSFGESSAERFWVNIPYTPPPDPEAEEPPRFADILKFREEFGLDLDVKGDEGAINDRIFNLIGDWHSPHTPQGEVARSSKERWGVPLRLVDVAEMDYREWYVAVNIPRIEEWAEAHRAGTYAGYYVAHSAGGILHIGFTSDQVGALAEMKSAASLVGQERLAAYPVVPSHSLSSLRSTLVGVEAAWDSDPDLAETIVSAGVDESNSSVEVAGTDTGLMESRLKVALGSQAPIRYVYEDEGIEYGGRNHSDGRIHAGDRLIGEKAGDSFNACTAGYGAWDRVGTKVNGEPKIAPFVLTSGHCAPVGRVFSRQDAGGAVYPGGLKKIGHVARNAFFNNQQFRTDGAAILLNSGGLMPYYIFLNGRKLKPVGPAGTTKPGETLCFSGVGTNARKCGEVIGVRRRLKKEGLDRKKQLFIITRFAGLPGDSGSPVWNPRTGRSVGILSGGPNRPGLVKDWVTPLLRPPGFDANRVPGVLNAPGMNSLHLAVAGD